MKLKSRVFIGASAFLMSVCALISQVGAMVSDDDEEVPPDLGGVGAFARDSLVVFGSELQDPQQQLFVEAQAGNLAGIINLIMYDNVHTRAADANGDTMWHILVCNRKWGIIKSLLNNSTTGVMVPTTVVNRCRQSFVACINKRNYQRKTPYDLALDNYCGAALKSSISGNLPPNLRSRLPVGLQTWK